VTGAMVDGVAAELELETQPFMVSSTALGGGVTQSLRGSGAESSNFTTAFRGETPGRQDR
jgi:general secretion pathway protein A